MVLTSAVQLCEFASKRLQPLSKTSSRRGFTRDINALRPPMRTWERETPAGAAIPKRTLRVRQRESGGGERGRECECVEGAGGERGRARKSRRRRAPIRRFASGLDSLDVPRHLLVSPTHCAAFLPAFLLRPSPPMASSSTPRESGAERADAARLERAVARTRASRPRATASR